MKHALYDLGPKRWMHRYFHAKGGHWEVNEHALPGVDVAAHNAAYGFRFAALTWTVYSTPAQAC